jgi:hypothetical protein
MQLPQSRTWPPFDRIPFKLALDIIITLWCGLRRDGAGNGIRHKKNSNGRMVRFLLQRHGETQRVVHYFSAIGRIVDNK